MKKPRLTLSEAAVSDILEQAEWYKQQAGTGLSRRWERAVSSALLGLLQRPRTGALCSFRATALRDVRRAPVAGFPKLLVFYRTQKDELLILRVVHGARDLESLL